ncbi:prepilin peptidase [Enterococcus sp. 5H]|uniref:prepilin peptidase n=1 Tax=Enterococcus sp. 5H TaxID=1229490 RepID=UPI0023048AF0|nr:A24 family peptidase [Enterococcus sp. 5H]MDA9471910.1 Late competence protein ComC, processing protease [Enterococcus sp. 5H]
MLIVYFIFGCILGSFLCLVAERVPAKKSIIIPGSHCAFCQTKLKVFELIPLISILLLRFRCRYCQHRLPITYFLSELYCGMLCVLVFQNTQPLYSFSILAMAFLLSLTDIFYLIVEPRLFYPLGIILCIEHIILALPIHFFTCFIVFLCLIILNYLVPDSVGGGDIFLLTLWGALLGSQALILLLFVASGSGLCFFLFYRFILKQELQQLPFVPFLSFGLLFVLLLK